MAARLPRGTAARAFGTLRDYVGRGVATTATYEARAFGVHSGMGLMKAARLAPDAIRLPVDFDAYRRYSRLFKQAVATIAPRIEDRGIDEIYIDLTDVDPPPIVARETSVIDPLAETRALAQSIKDAVRAATGLVVVDRHRAEQAPRQDRIRARQARWR